MEEKTGLCFWVASISFFSFVKLEQYSRESMDLEHKGERESAVTTVATDTAAAGRVARHGTEHRVGYRAVACALREPSLFVWGTGNGCGRKGFPASAMPSDDFCAGTSHGRLRHRMTVPFGLSLRPGRAS